MPIVTPKLMTPVIAAVLCLIMVPWSIVHAASEFKQTSSADPQGSIEIDVMSGSVEIDGWDRPEVEVTGQPDDLADRVRVSTSGDKTTLDTTFRETVSALDKSVQKGILHKNTASRYKSRLSARVKAAATK